MSEAKPRLVTFATSHFCEKARWALDWHGIAYSEIGWAPGLHQILASRCGATQTSLPILLDGTAVIEGSSAIIDWAEMKAGAPGRSLAPAGNLSEAAEIERRSNEVIGAHVRRLAYAELLPGHSDHVKTALLNGAVDWHRLAGTLMWPVSWRLMMRMYDIGADAAAQSRARLEAELDWLDAKLSDGRTYFAGDQFSRVDITVASLLAAFARPKEMKAYAASRLLNRLPPTYGGGANGQ